MTFPITISSLVEEISTKTLLVEVRDEKKLAKRMQFLGMDISENFLQKISSRDDEQKTIVVTPESGNFFQIAYFFPDEKNLEESRAEIFAQYKNSVAVFADGDELDALETFALATYQFQKYKTKTEENHRYFLRSEKTDDGEWQKRKNLISSIYAARDRVNTPAQDLNPESIVRELSTKKWNHFSVKIFGDNELRDLGCNLIRAVGQGSVRESFMVILEPKNPPAGEIYACIGKGVTFDAGGIQIKPDKYMLDMKCDMAGAAGMLGVAEYLDSLESLPVNSIFGFAFVENMTGSAAFKPMDIFTAYNGTTVEIHHTDAEGRLVLADVMAYIEKNYSPEHIITMATLTGACIYAVGMDTAGIMGDDEEIISSLQNDNLPFESVWRLPFLQKIRSALKSDIADIKNLSDTEKAGSSVGAAFLSYFQGNAKFTHLDIAGPAFRTKQYGPMTTGGTGWGVKKLSHFFENKQ